MNEKQTKIRLLFNEWLDRSPVELLREVVKMEREGLLREELERCLAAREEHEREWRRKHRDEIADVPF
jgi:hypothetical protein